MVMDNNNQQKPEITMNDIKVLHKSTRLTNQCQYSTIITKNDEKNSN